MKKFNFKKIGITVLSFVLVITVFISCFAFNVSAATGDSYPFTRSWLYEQGLIDDLSNAYDVFMPTADTSGATYYRCDINGNAANINSNKGQFTVADWGHGTLSNGLYSYSRRIGFKQTFDFSEYSNFRTISNFMKIPKGETVKISFYFRITGTVYGWENTPFADNISMSYYTTGSYSISNTSAYYNTSGESSYWFVGNTDPLVGVGEGTPVTEVCITQYVTAGSSDVFINSIHFNLNRIRWGGDISLSANGTVFLAGLVVDWNSEISHAIKNDITTEQNITQNKNFFDTVIDFFNSFFSKIYDPFRNAFDNIIGFFGSLYNWISSLGDRIGQFFDDLWSNISGGFNNILSAITSPFITAINRIGNVFGSAIDTFVAFVSGLWNWGVSS